MGRMNVDEIKNSKDLRRYFKSEHISGSPKTPSDSMFKLSLSMKEKQK
jgi:hypothetical protein